jgi:hypothetical protein
MPVIIYAVLADEFDAAYADGGIFQLTMHPHIMFSASYARSPRASSSSASSRAFGRAPT